jgi:hypothetical protein
MTLRDWGCNRGPTPLNPHRAVAMPPTPVDASVANIEKLIARGCEPGSLTV